MGRSSSVGGGCGGAKDPPGLDANGGGKESGRGSFWFACSANGMGDDGPVVRGGGAKPIGGVGARGSSPAFIPGGGAFGPPIMGGAIMGAGMGAGMGAAGAPGTGGNATTGAGPGAGGAGIVMAGVTGAGGTGCAMGAFAALLRSVAALSSSSVSSYRRGGGPSSMDESSTRSWSLSASATLSDGGGGDGVCAACGREASDGFVDAGLEVGAGLDAGANGIGFEAGVATALGFDAGAAAGTGFDGAPATAAGLEDGPERDAAFFSSAR